MDWNAENIERLRLAVAAGRTFREIGDELGCSRNAAIGKAGRLGFTSVNAPNWPPVISDKRKTRDKKLAAPQGTTTGTMLVHVSQDERNGGLNGFKLVPKQEIPLDIVDIETRPVSLFDRRSDQCCWPLDDGMFCGMPISDKSYCKHHHQASVRPAQEYRKKHYPVRRW